MFLNRIAPRFVEGLDPRQVGANHFCAQFLKMYVGALCLQQASAGTPLNQRYPGNDLVGFARQSLEVTKGLSRSAGLPKERLPSATTVSLPMTSALG